MKYFTNNILFISCFLLPINLLANEQWYIDQISKVVEIDYARTCDSIVDGIRKDTRER